MLTARGRCYRFEGGDHTPLERLWDFTMREIIVLGSRDQVETVRQTLVRQVSDLVTRLELDGQVQIATDPFFTAGDEGRRLMQQAGALKYELLLAVDADGRGVATTSFNHHHDFFGARFDITLSAADQRTAAASRSASSAGCSPSSRSMASTSAHGQPLRVRGSTTRGATVH